MTVRELVELLRQYRDDTEVFLSCDEEGNYFNRLDGDSRAWEDTDGELIHESEISRDEDLEQYDISSHVVVLWP